MDEQLELEADIQQEMAASGDFVEGVTAFVAEARSAALRGRREHAPPTAVVRRAVNRIPAALARRPPSAAVASPRARAVAAARGLLRPRRRGASPDLLTPESGGSPNADDIDTLYWLIFAVALVVFVGVEGALIYSLVKFRARKGAVPAQIRGNTRLEIGWTVGAAVILVVLAVVTFVKLPGIRNPPNSGADGLQLADGTLVAAGPTKRLPPNGKSLNVCVNGQQYIWRYTYASDCAQRTARARRSPTRRWSSRSTRR